MKNALTFLLLIGTVSAQVEPVIHNNVYCIHSNLYNNTTFINSSNIYVLKGTNDTVFIFGMGYGKPEQIRVYRNVPTLNTNINQDAHLLDSVVSLLNVTSPKIMFICPHQHLDHINQAFVDVVDSLYGTVNTKIYVHRKDFKGATCNDHCCDGSECVQGSPFFGVPYEWDAPTLLKFRSLGRSNDSCGQVVKRFTTSYGMWWVMKGTDTHTPGALDLQCTTVPIRINGSDIAVCPTTGFDVLPCHGVCGVDSVYVFP